MPRRLTSLIRRIAPRWRRTAFVHIMRAMPRTVMQCMRIAGRLLPSRLHAYSVAGGLGDELMIWGVLQTLAEKRPAAQITYHSRFADLFQLVESRVNVVPYQDKKLPRPATGLGYVGRTQLSINEQMAARLGLEPTSYPIPLPPLSANLPDLPAEDEGPLVMIQPVASGWTPNKQWPLEYWEELVAGLPADATVVELGQHPFFATPPAHPRFISLAGRTSVKQYLSAISRAAVFIGPPSSGMHVAHAYGVRSVVIVGGYEAPVYPYPEAIQLYTNLPCSPCWLCTQCPFDRKCLTKISPATVRDAVLTQLHLPKSEALVQR